MRPSPVRLKHYQLSRLSIEPVEGFSADFTDNEPYPAFRNADFNIEVRVSESDNSSPAIFMVDLNLSAKPKDGHSFPYQFVLAAKGVVGFHGDDEPNTRRELVAVNGASMLYSALREVLLSLSFRFPNGPVLLPSANFIDLRGNLNSEPMKVKPLQRKVRAATPQSVPDTRAKSRETASTAQIPPKKRPPAKK